MLNETTEPHALAMIAVRAAVSETALLRHSTLGQWLYVVAYNQRNLAEAQVQAEKDTTMLDGLLWRRTLTNTHDAPECALKVLRPFRTSNFASCLNEPLGLRLFVEQGVACVLARAVSYEASYFFRFGAVFCEMGGMGFLARGSCWCCWGLLNSGSDAGVCRLASRSNRPRIRAVICCVPVDLFNQ